MMNFSLFDVILNYWLSDDLVWWNLNSLISTLNVVLGLLNNWVHLNGSIFFSVKLNINVLSLDNRLNISLVINFFSWTSHVLSSSSLLENRFSHDGLSGLVLRFGFLEIYSFSVINNLSLDYRLGIDLLSGSLEGSVNDLFGELGWSSLNWGIVYLGLSSIDLELYVFGKNGRLDVLLSNGCFSWNVDRNRFGFSSAINDGLFVLSFSVNWTGNNLSSNNRGLYNTLFDNWLLDNSLGDDGL